MGVGVSKGFVCFDDRKTCKDRDVSLKILYIRFLIIIIIIKFYIIYFVVIQL